MDHVKYSILTICCCSVVVCGSLNHSRQDKGSFSKKTTFINNNITTPSWRRAHTYLSIIHCEHSRDYVTSRCHDISNDIRVNYWPIRMSGLLLLCTELTLFCIELPENCIYLNQSELSNFFMYIISAVMAAVNFELLRIFCLVLFFLNSLSLPDHLSKDLREFICGRTLRVGHEKRNFISTSNYLLFLFII